MEWQDITTAPKTGERILVCGGLFEGADLVHWKRNSWVSEDGTFAIGEGFFSHWMPLPSPPKPITPKEKD